MPTSAAFSSHVDAVSASRRLLLVSLAGTAALAACADTSPLGPAAAAGPPRFDPDRRIGPSIWNGTSPRYHFERTTVAAAGSGRRYRLWMAWPRGTAPAGGHPLACLVDGNAVADTLSNAQLEASSARGNAPAILAIGPDSDLRFDVAMRAYDYTPSVRMDGPTWDDEERGRPGGGADPFLDFIVTQAVPALAARVPLDPRRRTLWGHSYGGLFALHALLRRPQFFSRYAAADPSLWWQGAFILREAEHPAPLPGGRETTLLLMQGASVEGERPAAPPPAGVGAARAERLRRQRAVPPQAGRDLVGRLGRAGVRAEYLAFPGIPHGPMLAASLPATLALAARPPTA
jgi:hypothetical protein